MFSTLNIMNPVRQFQGRQFNAKDTPENPMRSSEKKLIAGLLFVAVSLLFRGQVGNVIFNDTFADGERSTQNLPNSLAWFHNTNSAVPASNLAVRNGSLDYVVADASRIHGLGWKPAHTIEQGLRELMKSQKI